MPGISIRPIKKTAIHCGLFFVALILAANSAQAACNFRAPLTNSVPFGAISPAQTGNVVTSIALRIQCTGGDRPGFSFGGLYDIGPGLHRLRNLTVPSAYLNYRITSSVQANRLTVNLTVSGADYRDAWVGSYEDTLTVTVTP